MDSANPILELAKRVKRKRCKMCSGRGYLRFGGKRDHQYVCPRCYDAYFEKNMEELEA